MMTASIALPRANLSLEKSIPAEERPIQGTFSLRNMCTKTNITGPASQVNSASMRIASAVKALSNLVNEPSRMQN
jgi:hypothetical protein